MSEGPVLSPVPSRLLTGAIPDGEDTQEGFGGRSVNCGGDQGRGHVVGEAGRCQLVIRGLGGGIRSKWHLGVQRF